MLVFYKGVSLCREPLLRESPIPRRRWPTENELNSVSGDVVVVNLFCTILAGWFVTKPFSHLKEMEMNFLVGLCCSVFTGCTRPSFLLLSYVSMAIAFMCYFVSQSRTK